MLEKILAFIDCVETNCDTMSKIIDNGLIKGK